MTRQAGRSPSCFTTTVWVVLGLLVVAFLVLFALSTLFDLGLWDAFWTYIGRTFNLS